MDMDAKVPVIDRRLFLIGSAAALASLRAFADNDPYGAAPERMFSDADWQKKLSPEGYKVLRRGDTEAANSSPLSEEHRDGMFVCAGCDLPLFHSDWKFDAGTGWPSFYKIIDDAMVTKVDHTQAEEHPEYHCARCLGHQGYLFADGPQPWGLRYSNNGAALKFTPT